MANYVLHINPVPNHHSWWNVVIAFDKCSRDDILFSLLDILLASTKRSLKRAFNELRIVLYFFSLLVNSTSFGRSTSKCIATLEAWQRWSFWCPEQKKYLEANKIKFKVEVFLFSNGRKASSWKECIYYDPQHNGLKIENVYCLPRNLKSLRHFFKGWVLVCIRACSF